MLRFFGRRGESSTIKVTCGRVAGFSDEMNSISVPFFFLFGQVREDRDCVESLKTRGCWNIFTEKLHLLYRRKTKNFIGYQNRAWLKSQKRVNNFRGMGHDSFISALQILFPLWLPSASEGWPLS